MCFLCKSVRAVRGLVLAAARQVPGCCLTCHSARVPERLASSRCLETLGLRAAALERALPWVRQALRALSRLLQTCRWLILGCMCFRLERQVLRVVLLLAVLVQTVYSARQALLAVSAVRGRQAQILPEVFMRQALVTSLTIDRLALRRDQTTAPVGSLYLSRSGATAAWAAEALTPASVG